MRHVAVGFGFFCARCRLRWGSGLLTTFCRLGVLTWIVALSADGAEPDRLRCANVLRESVRACFIDVLGLMVVSCECCITSVLSGQETCLLRDSMFLTQPGADSLCCCCSGQCLSTCTLPSRAAGAATCCWNSLSHCCGSCCCYDQFWNSATHTAAGVEGLPLQACTLLVLRPAL